MRKKVQSVLDNKETVMSTRKYMYPVQTKEDMIL